MGKGLQMMLKALGVEIAPEHIAMIQALIPQLPAKINEAAQTINAALANFDGRLRALEETAKASMRSEGQMVENLQARLKILENHTFYIREQIALVYQEVLNARRTEPEFIGTGRRGRARSGAGTDGAGNGGGSNDAGR